MVRVLFIDDEMSALDALRRVLRPRRSEWEMEFLNDSSTAVQVADRFAPDVIVTDLRMPVVDGLTLLN